MRKICECHDEETVISLSLNSLESIMQPNIVGLHN
jgi:hypothetical protein